jgi:hypothetical protein
MFEKSGSCTYRKSSIMVASVATIAFSVALSTSAFADTGITNQNDLEAITGNGAYTLTNSFSVAAPNSGSSYVGGVFTGTLNGGGFTISGLLAPLFNVIGDGTSTGGVTNLNLATGGEHGITEDAPAAGDWGNTTGVLAGKLAAGSTVDDVNVSGRIEATGNDAVGGLVGTAEANSTISHSRSSVEITSGDHSDVGGLVGDSYGATISNSVSEGDVSTTYSNVYLGGLVGYSSGATHISDSSSSSVVNTAGGYGGGLIGEVNNDESGSTTIESSSASGNVLVAPDVIAHGLGGLIGFVTGAGPSPTTITNSSASGVINSRESRWTYEVGGLIGRVESLVSIANSSATGDVLTTNANAVGGLIGSLYGSGSSVIDSSASGLVSNIMSDFGNHICFGGLFGYVDASDDIIRNDSASGNLLLLGGRVTGNIGGLVGRSNSAINDSSATGTIFSDATSEYVGGLVGYMNGDLNNSSATGSITIQGDHSVFIGGLVGSASSSNISNSSASGLISAMGDSNSQIGGLVGFGYGTISNSSASGSIEVGTYSLYTGGLAGQFNNVTNSAASGSVTVGLHGDHVGGLLGWGYGITNSHASGAVTAGGTVIGESDGGVYVGGLVGQALAITNSSASGFVTAPGDSEYVGGLAGATYGAVTNSAASGVVTGYQYVGSLTGYSYQSAVDSFATGVTIDVNGSENALVDNNGGLDGSGHQNQVSAEGAIQGPYQQAGYSEIIGSSALNAASLNVHASAWGQNPYINSGVPYLLALINSGLYTNVTPAPSRLVAEIAAPNINPMVSIQLKATIALFEYLAGDLSIHLTPDDFSVLGATGVTEANLSTVLKLLKGVDLTTLDANTINKNVKIANALLKKSSKVRKK